jgi:hypothetical protein
MSKSTWNLFPGNLPFTSKALDAAVETARHSGGGPVETRIEDVCLRVEIIPAQDGKKERFTADWWWVGETARSLREWEDSMPRIPMLSGTVPDPTPD